MAFRLQPRSRVLATDAWLIAMHGLAHESRHPALGAESRLPAPAARTRADLAWEFLRRDPAYRAAFDAAMRRGPDCGRWAAGDFDWGLEFPADPQLAAGAAEVFWRAQGAPAVVVELEPCATTRAGALDLGHAPWTQRRQGEVVHLQTGGGLQVRALTGDLHQALAAVAPLDDGFEVRLRTLARLHRALRGRPLGPDLTAQQLRRLHQALQALDGRGQGLSHRDLAVELFGRAAVAREPWKSSSVRDATLRRVRMGESLMRGGYRTLLQKRSA